MKLKDTMPEFHGATGWLNRKIRKSDLKNITIVHFWSVSCSLCKELLPKLYAISKNYEVDLIAVHMPRQPEDEVLATVKDAVQQYGMKEAVFLDHKKNLTNIYNPRFVPTYYVFDQEQQLRHIQIAGSMRLIENKIQYLSRNNIQ
ncbi:redoxin domain-containing protein [Bacillus ndiopicus]|uniref:redoxin domain-containing protein n=1 Tax=Bacillus ndiopicus TaxID=1347368 RepID=UPI0005A638E5|nr:redoxin domain-containing protein [Bacillus ndiopicus]